MFINKLKTSLLVQKKIKFLTSFNLTRYHPKKYVPAFFQVKTVPAVAFYI